MIDLSPDTVDRVLVRLNLQTEQNNRALDLARCTAHQLVPDRAAYTPPYSDQYCLSAAQSSAEGTAAGWEIGEMRRPINNRVVKSMYENYVIIQDLPRTLDQNASGWDNLRVTSSFPRFLVFVRYHGTCKTDSKGHCSTRLEPRGGDHKVESSINTLHCVYISQAGPAGWIDTDYIVEDVTWKHSSDCLEPHSATCPRSTGILQEGSEFEPDCQK